MTTKKAMKRIHINGLLTLVFLSIFALTSCKKDPILVTNVALNKTSLQLFKGDTEQLTATITPADAENKELTWTSSKTDIVSVDKTGKVTAIGLGEAEVKATAGGKFAICKVVVVAVPVSGITLDKENHEMTIGEEVVLKATVTPDNAEDKTVTWDSSDKAVATVDNNGKVVAKGEGEATITAKTGDKSAQCRVKVNPILVESVTISKTSLELVVGERLKLSATVLPENATHKTVTWTSSNKSVATVTEAGLVTAVAAGTAEITAAAGGKTAKCIVIVELPVRPPRVGDFYYEDGSTSDQIDNAKKIIGIVFWIGDATKQDKAMKRDFPKCTNGLVVSLTEILQCQWQENYKTYNNTVGAWVEANAKQYETPVTAEDDVSTNLNKTVGYNNSKALEAFNNAPENSAWPVTAIVRLKEFAAANPVPATTTGWYLPSPKELTLMCHGPFSGNIRFLANKDKEVMKKINAALDKIGAVGVQKLTENTYRSSAERNNNISQGVLFYNSSLQGPAKDALLKARPIFAF